MFFFGVYWYSELSPANGILNWYIDIGMDEKNTLLRVIPSTLTYYFNILSSILWHSFWHCVWQSLWHVFGSRRGWPTASGAGDVEFRSRRGRPTASRDRHMARRRRRTRIGRRGVVPLLQSRDPHLHVANRIFVTIWYISRVYILMGTNYINEDWR